MVKTVASVDGMMCGMCEAHMNDAVRRAFNIKKVTSSHSKNTTTIISEEPIDVEKLREVVTGLGYTMGEVTSEPYKKSFFGR